MKPIRILFIYLFIYKSTFAQSWKTVGDTISNPVWQGGVGIVYTDTINHLLYAGGMFDSIGEIATHNIARWDGEKWYSLNAPKFNFGINAIALWHGSIYVGGTQNNKVHKWDGSTWTTLPAMDGWINVLKVFHDTLYAGGNFFTAGKVFTKGIAKWSGTKWLRVGDSTGIGGCDLCGGIGDIELYKDTLVIAGIFPLASGDTVNNIAKWDGKKWRPLGRGLEKGMQFPWVDNILCHDNKLYASGAFLQAGGQPAKGIAVWDGTKWSNVGLGFNISGPAFVGINFFRDKLIAYGDITQSGTENFTELAEWDGTAWTGFEGNQLSGNFRSSDIFNGEFYLCGGFRENVGGQIVKTIARWSPLEKEVQPTLCSNTCEGAATVTAIGGLSPYTYQWGTSPVQTTQTATGLCPGTYSVSVTDVSGSPTTGIVIITSTSAIKITDTVKDVLCNGGNTGEIKLSVTGGIIPYSYNWSSSDTTLSISNLAAGSYQVTVTDSLGCMAEDSTVVNEPLTPLVMKDTIMNASCAVCANGGAAVTVGGGTPPYTYEWSSGGAADSIENKLPGVYIVTVTDSNGCVARDTAVIGFNTGIPSAIVHPPFTIIPNPVTDRLEMINGKLETGDVVTVTDLYGRVMERKEMMNPTSNFKLQTINYPPGIYFLSVRTKQGWSAVKFVKR